MTTKTVRVELTGDPSSAVRSLTVVSDTAQRTAAKAEGAMTRASSRIGGAFGRLDGLLGQFGVPFTGVLGVLGTKMEDFQTKGTTAFAKVQEAGKLAAIGLAAGFAVIGVESVHLADKFEESEARLKTAVKNSGEAWAKAEPAIKKTNDQLENLGFNNVEAENSLSRLVTATKNVTKSTELMGLAANIARARHISLEAATDLLVKVEGGRYAQLGRTLGVSKEVIASFKNQDDAIRFLSDRYRNQAQAAADTFNGKITVMKAKLEDVGIKIGTFLIPWIERLIGAVQTSITWFEKHKTIAEALAITLGVVLVAAAAAWVASMIAAAAATVVAMAPVLVIVAAIGLAVADAVLIWDRFGPAVVDAINNYAIPALNALVDTINGVIDVLNLIPGVDIGHVGSVGDIGGGGGGTNANGGVGSTPYGPNLPAGQQYSKPIGPGLNGYADGGWVKAPVGMPQLAIVHGGEFVVSRDMQKNAMSGGDTYNIYTTEPRRVPIEIARQRRARQQLVTL